MRYLSIIVVSFFIFIGTMPVGFSVGGLSSEEEEDTNFKSARQKISPEDLESAAEKLLKEFKGVSKEVVIPPKLSTSLSVLGCDEERRASSMSSRTTNSIAAILAFLTSAAYAEMIMFNPSIGDLLGVDPSYEGETPPWQTIVSGTVFGAWTLPKFFNLSKGVLGWMTRSKSPYDEVSQDRDRISRTAQTYMVMLPSVIVLTAFSIYTYVQINSIDMSLFFIIFSVAAGIPWVINQIAAAYTEVFDQADSCCTSLRKKPTLHERKRRHIISRFASSFRRVLDDPVEAQILWGGIANIREFIKENTENMDVLRKQVELQAIDRDMDQEGDEERQSDDLLRTKITLKRMGVLFILQQLYNHGTVDDKYYLKHVFHKNKCKRLFQTIYKENHPGWYRGMHILGLVVGGVASVSLWYGWVKMFDNTLFGSSAPPAPVGNATTFFPVEDSMPSSEDYVSYTLGTLVSFFYIPYMMQQTGKAFSHVSAIIAGYNPIQGENTPRMTDINYQVLRGSFAFLWLIKSIPTMWPYSVIGGEGMGYGIGPWAPEVPFEWQLITLIPSMIAFGAMDYNSMSQIQKIITKMKSRAPRNSQATAQQRVVDILKDVIKWVTALDRGIIIPLGDCLKTDAGNWSQTFTGDVGRLDGYGSFNGRIASRQAVTYVLNEDKNQDEEEGEYGEIEPEGMGRNWCTSSEDSDGEEGRAGKKQPLLAREESI